MVEAKPLSAADIAEIKPVYVQIPDDWQAGGSRGVLGKRGQSLILINFYTPDNLKISFFSERMAKTADGKWAVEAFHYNEQMERAKKYAEENKTR